MFAGLLAASALTLAPPAAFARHAVGRARRPKKFVQFFLPGGFDSLYSVDPKERNEVNPGIVPYYSPSVLLERNSSRVGPLLAPLAPYLPRMAIINGILSSTVAHEVGFIQTQQLRRNVVSMTDQSAVALVGQALQPEAPLHGLHLGYPPFITWRPPRGRCFIDSMGGPLLQKLITLANDERGLGEEANRQIAALTNDRRTREAASAVQTLLQRLHGERGPERSHVEIDAFPPALRALVDGFDHSQINAELMNPFEWAAFLIEKDIAPSIQIIVPGVWDSHFMNDPWQKAFGAHLVAGLRWLLDRLAAARLLDDVGILVSSELGRFPYMNNQEGKDHFPVFSAILMGPGVRPGQYGRTDREMVGLPVSLTTGQPRNQADTLLTLDDLGRTILEWVGLPSPENRGYGGRVLDFCLA